MGYNIYSISKLSTTNFNNLDQNKNTVRKSLDGTKFIVSGKGITKYTIEEIKELINNEDWNLKT